MGAPVRRDGTDWVLELRVQPRASRSEFAGVHGDRLRLRLNAPPVDGRANAALVEFIASVFDVPRARVVLEQGLTTRDKRVRVSGAAALPPSLQALASQ
ncbi:MAG TPA: DUF167 family protein [Steroidobacteraceae bacterium]